MGDGPLQLPSCRTRLVLGIAKSFSFALVLLLVRQSCSPLVRWKGTGPNRSVRGI